MNNESPFAFEWDDSKANSNLKKHGVSFDEASTVFEDVNAFIQADKRHSDDESRVWLIGYSEQNRLLILSYTERSDGRIRLISARRVTPRERAIYEKRSAF